MIDILQRPIIGGGSDEFISRWNAVGNPIVYRLQRKDYEVSVFETSGIDDYLMLRFTGVNLTATFPTDTVVTFKSDDEQYNDTAEVSSSVYSFGDTLVILDYNFEGTGAYGGGANIDASKPNYRVEINLYGPGSGDELLTDNPFVYSPDASGLVRVNVSAIVRSLLSEDIDIDLTVNGVDDSDTNAFKEFRLGYTEVWTGSAESEVIDTESVFGVFAAKQIPSTYGGNMVPYMAFEDSNPLGKWLTKFTALRAWVGYPFAMSVIVDDVIDNIEYTLLNEVEVTNVAGSLFTIVANGFSIDGVAKLYSAESGDPMVSELTVTAETACDNPVYLMTRNSLGGPLFWMFDHSQEYTHDYGDNRKAKRLVLTTENLTLNEWEALQDFIGLGEVYKNNIVEFTSETIKTSSRIGSQVYQVFPDGSKIGVIVIPTQNTTLTRYHKHSFEIEIEYPEEFTA